MPQQKKGQVVIADTDQLYRRIHPSNSKAGKLTSGTFVQRRDPCLSVHLAKLTTLEEVTAVYPDYGVVSIEAGFVRNLGLEVYHDPLPNDYSHAIIRGKITHSKAVQIRDSAEVLREPRAKTD